MEMNKKIIIAILVVILAVLVLLIGFTLFNQSNVQYKTVHISNGTTIEVPSTDDATWTQDESGIKFYNCKSKKVVMNSFNSAEDLSLSGAFGYAAARDLLLSGATTVENYKNFEIKERTINDTHFYIVNIGNDETHDNIIIGSENLDILKHMLDSLVFGEPETADVDTGSTTSNNNVAPVTKNTTDKKKYTQEDLDRAAAEGYMNGYDDSYYDNYYDDYYEDGANYEGSSSSGDFETTFEDGNLE